jgi:hypothetical protein
VQVLGTQRKLTDDGARPSGEALAHIPGDSGWPVVGHTLAILADPKGFVEQRAQRYGPVNRSNVFGRPNITLLGPEANELVLLDPQKLFSSALGWGFIPRSLVPPRADVARF